MQLKIICRSMLKIFYRKFYKCWRYRLEKSYFRHLAVTVIPFNSVDSIFQSSGGIESTLLDVGITVIARVFCRKWHLLRCLMTIIRLLTIVLLSGNCFIDPHLWKTDWGCQWTRQMFGAILWTVFQSWHWQVEKLIMMRRPDRWWQKSPHKNLWSLISNPVRLLSIIVDI